MSKSEWKEHPNASNPQGYKFLDGADKTVIAWEILRREPAYRNDWHNRDVLKATKHYDPAKIPHESEPQWFARAMQSHNPKISTAYEQCAKKWGLMALHDPEQPYSPEIVFVKLWSEYPYLLEQADHFYQLLVEDETEERLIEHVDYKYAVVVYNLECPLEPQQLAADKLLKSRKASMRNSGRITPQGHANKPDNWARHIRVLDALRMTPPMTHGKIAKMLLPNKVKGMEPDYVRAEGFRLVQAARKMAKSGYKKILLYKHPKKDCPPS